MSEVIPQKIVRVDDIDFPLESWTNPKLFDTRESERRHTTISKLNSKTIALIDETFNCQTHRDIVNCIVIDVDIIPE